MINGLNGGVDPRELYNSAKTKSSAGGDLITRDEAVKIINELRKKPELNADDQKLLTDLTKSFEDQGQSFDLMFNTKDRNIVKPLPLDKVATIEPTQLRFDIKNKAAVASNGKPYTANSSNALYARTFKDEKEMNTKGNELVKEAKLSINGAGIVNDYTKAFNHILEDYGFTKDVISDKQVQGYLRNRFVNLMGRDGQMMVEKYGKDLGVTSVNQLAQKMVDIAVDSVTGKGKFDAEKLKVIQLGGNALGMNNLLSQFMESSSVQSGKEAGIDGKLGPRSLAAIDQMYRRLEMPARLTEIEPNKDSLLYLDTSGSMDNNVSEVNNLINVMNSVAQSKNSSFTQVKHKMGENMLQVLDVNSAAVQNLANRPADNKKEIIVETDALFDQITATQLKDKIDALKEKGIELIVKNPDAPNVEPINLTKLFEGLTVEDISAKYCNNWMKEGSYRPSYNSGYMDSKFTPILDYTKINPDWKQR